MVITLVLSSALYRAFCRRGSRGLEDGSFWIGLTGYAGVIVTIWGAFAIIDKAPSGRDFTAAAPGLRVVGDITYIPTVEGWLYLATRSTAAPSRSSPGCGCGTGRRS